MTGSSRFRAIIRHDDFGAACHVGAPVHTAWETVEFNSAEIAEALRKARGSHVQVQIVGVEVVAGEQP